MNSPSDMSGRHQKTHEAIFADPVRANVEWSAIESMLRHAGATVEEGNGSRVRVLFRGKKRVFHRPHPEKETDKGALMSVREYLVLAGFGPETEG